MWCRVHSFGRIESVAGFTRFWNEGASLTSGRASETWTFASVFVHECGGRELAPILTYALALRDRVAVR